MRKILTVCDEVVVKAISFIAISCYIILIALVFFMVLARYVFQWSIIGLDELALISAMWLYMTGSILATRQNEHIVVDFLPEMLKGKRTYEFHRIFVGLLIFIATCFFVYLAWDFYQFSTLRPQRTAGLKIPELISRSAMILASIACLLFTLRNLFSGIHFYRPNTEEE